ncbi:MAG TPA: isoprenylcysteine carboxylmethyltransferase family protein [Pyrinomonadaceae bacterium]
MWAQAMPSVMLPNMWTEEFYPIFFTVFQISWAFVWAARHIEIRKGRRYADNRARGDTNSRYKVVSYFLFILQNILCLASFWSNSQLLLKIHDSNSMRFAGVILISLATVLYFKALARLGRNYSPCFDSHLPFELISSGPYKFTRHPMYFAKLIIAIGDFVLSGSLWFLAIFMYLMLETVRTIAKEEKYLGESVQGYDSYRKRTARMIPFVF